MSAQTRLCHFLSLKPLNLEIAFGAPLPCEQASDSSAMELATGLPRKRHLTACPHLPQPWQSPPPAERLPGTLADSCKVFPSESICSSTFSTLLSALFMRWMVSAVPENLLDDFGDFLWHS